MLADETREDGGRGNGVGEGYFMRCVVFFDRGDDNRHETLVNLCLCVVRITWLVGGEAHIDLEDEGGT